MSNTDAVLANANVSFDISATLDGLSYTDCNGIDSIGAVGSMATPKDKTTISDTVKKYGTGMRDTPDKDIKGQYYAGDVDQQAIIDAAKSGKTVRMKAVWPQSDTGVIVELALLGFQMDENSSEDWQTFTIKAKQSGQEQWGDSTVTWS